MKLSKSKVDYVLVTYSGLAFGYAYFSFDKDVIGLRGSRFNRLDDPLFFWLGLLFVCVTGIYCIYLVLSTKEN